jgi:PAS domain S-box-containing protein
VVPTIIVDTSRRIRFANEAFAELLGYSIEELEALPSSAVLSSVTCRAGDPVDGADLRG